MVCHANVIHRLLAGISKASTYRVSNTDMRNTPTREKRFLTQKRPINKLIDQDKFTRLHIFTQAATGRHRKDICHPETLQSIDVRLVGYMAGTMDVAATMARQESNLYAVERTGKNLIGRRAVRGINRNPTTVFNAVDIVNSRATDNTKFHKCLIQ